VVSLKKKKKEKKKREKKRRGQRRRRRRRRRLVRFIPFDDNQKIRNSKFFISFEASPQKTEVFLEGS